MTTYLFAGGGTAGHVNPLLATADRLRERERDARVLVLGTAEGLEARLVPARGYELLTIPRLPFPRRPGAAALRFPGAIRASIDRTASLMEEHAVDAVVGFGGYASAPAYLAARRLGTPIAIHEQNARPGLANRLGARLTDHVGVAFAGTRLRGARVVGMPLRREIERLDLAAARAAAFDIFELDPLKPTLLVTGGSTGARSINRTLAAAIPALLGTGWQVLHIAGERDALADPGLAGYRLLAYCDRMELALSIADLAVSRAGATTASELAALGIPAVYIPYPVGNGEQRVNAREAVHAGGAILVSDAEFTPEWAQTSLVALLEDRASVAEMAARMVGVGRRDGADRMVDLLLEAVGGAGAGTVG
ncbi:UDP-N-acetylglucosamine--N-acetylmuramyl-(pentapeptide) pyrophosphoryl-undecaprenol N-acetylglucosamine transferase [Homoserinibacter sp. YIM 151385]|uniref:UDP-N-acetylglucosamine--N-acetylmuramyl- (pentapeptide) pyrophosphoryl-undecaprenol N-acetylglucosamine transferase n=1 Tax=Homoserinibacter sp. YIM 151385 TaxID=2985506 RepID=UPI0022F1320D|nr:UDP-N-acetylglucosamine--N-acetylmuramyl-(pentapeptide) pyrophosphoryl-undecaprenol N-acetylglucosamine transferase [Homoserinibacter sp. YIM 151385]WBU38739.1 UDP-N-acetylglucosamine--N-acetylmuramyl-(pentapeptide) pyrophosphoryl-undecaprenol N-acetylglucosamine transferase [Homoserinibacter sp. YIM 151385]